MKYLKKYKIFEKKEGGKNIMVNLRKNVNLLETK
jgi:hypothetical protein